MLLKTWPKKLTFKEIKPKFYSKYIYFINVHNYLLQKPTGGENIQQDYIHMRLAELKTFFDHNRAFCSYYRSRMTQMDEIYYTRSGFDVHAVRRFWRRRTIQYRPWL